MEEAAKNEGGAQLSLEPKEEAKVVPVVPEEDLSKKDTSKMTKKERK